MMDTAQHSTLNRLSCKLIATLLLLAVMLPALSAAKPDGGRELKRSDAKRWQYWHEIITAEIKVATRKFVQDRGQVLSMPVEVDVVLIGFDGSGGFHYVLTDDELDELMSSSSVENNICPMIRDIGQRSALCFSLSTVFISAGRVSQALELVERALQKNMVLAGQRPRFTHGPPNGPSDPLYTVDGSAVEDELLQILAQIYEVEGLGSVGTPGGGLQVEAHRLTIMVINPAKQRISPLMADRAAGQTEWLKRDVLSQLSRGDLGHIDLADQEAGFYYHYTYNSKGAGAAWLSSHNFMVLDLSAGPVNAGPMVSSRGRTSPAALPRIMPMFERIMLEVGTVHQITLQEHMVEAAATSHHKLMAGQVASALSSAIVHVMVPDVAIGRLEVAGIVLVQLIVLHDHRDFDLLDGAMEMAGPGIDTAIDLTSIQNAITALGEPRQAVVLMPQSSALHQHPGVLAALANARSTWSDVVMAEPPFLGLHQGRHSRIDSTVLIQELRRMLPLFTEHMDFGPPPPGHLASSVRHKGTRQLPCFVISLKSAPPDMMFEDGTLVASSHDMVVVLQLVSAVALGNGTAAANPQLVAGKEAALDPDDTHPDLRQYSGHALEGKPLLLDGAAGVTSRIISGLILALAGVVPTWERSDPLADDALVQDWRWSVGCLPGGPHTNSSRLSGVTLAVGHRNQLLSGVEVALRAVQSRLTAMDDLVRDLFEGPWMELTDMSHADKPTAPHVRRRNWLDDLAKRSHGFNNSMSPGVVARLNKNLAEVEAKLEQLSWSLFSQSWEAAEEQLEGLLAVADELILEVDADMHHCQAVAACCKVVHGPPIVMDLVAIIILVVLLLSFAAIGLSIITGRKTGRVSPIVATPPGSTRYGSGSRDLDSKLPVWRQSSAERSGLLPR